MSIKDSHLHYVSSFKHLKKFGIKYIFQTTDVPSKLLGAYYETILWFADGRNYFNKTSFK
jgi:hypothetical protein